LFIARVGDATLLHSFIISLKKPFTVYRIHTGHPSHLFNSSIFNYSTAKNTFTVLRFPCSDKCTGHPSHLFNCSTLQLFNRTTGSTIARFNDLTKNHVSHFPFSVPRKMHRSSVTGHPSSFLFPYFERWIHW